MTPADRDRYVHYGCGPFAPDTWRNFDVSPTLRLQRLPLVGRLFRGGRYPVFPDNAEYGDVVKGLSVAEGSCRAIYCSHVLEHLALEDLRIALERTHAYLAPGGSFRLVEGSCRAIYCSHVLEHLALEDLRIALERTHAYLAPGGSFRLVVPDLEALARDYVAS